MQHGPVLSVSYHLHETAKESEPQMKLCIYSAGSTQVRFGKMCLQICANAPLWPSWSLVSLVWHNNSFTLFPCISIDIFSLVLLFTSISLSLSASLALISIDIFLGSPRILKFDISYLHLDQSSNVSNLQLTWDLSCQTAKAFDGSAISLYRWQPSFPWGKHHIAIHSKPVTAFHFHEWMCKQKHDTGQEIYLVT